jgi:hypothetical protein
MFGELCKNGVGLASNNNISSEYHNNASNSNINQNINININNSHINNNNNNL